MTVLGMAQSRVSRHLAILREAGLLAVPAAENVLRIIPPLIVSEEEIDQAVDILDRLEQMVMVIPVDTQEYDQQDQNPYYKALG